MNPNSRKIEQSPLYVGEDEGEPYTLTVPTTWTTSPSAPVMEIRDSTGVDVTATVTQGTNAAVNGQVVTTARITGRLYRARHLLSAGGITAGEKYVMKIYFTTSTGDKSCFIDVIGQV